MAETNAPVSAAKEQPPFVPFHNEIYRFGLGRVGGDWHPATRLALVLASVMILGGLLVLAAWAHGQWHGMP